MILGICGFIGSGKDTVADYLCTCHGFQRLSFAASLKDAVSTIFGWDREMLEGKTPDSREWRDKIDIWWAKRLDIPHLTPRWVLQQWGTDVLRRGFHDDIWVASLEGKLRRTCTDIVISDCRFPNEIASIKSSGGHVIRVKRGNEPEWFESAVDYMSGPKTIGWALGKNVLDSYKIHASEYSWVGTNFDYVIENEGSLEDLYKKVYDLISEFNQG